MRARVAPGLIPEVARVGIGIAVRLGAPKPDISTVEAFRQMLLEARSIASIPASATGTLLSGIYRRLGITNEMTAKIKARATTDGIVDGVANGDAQLALFILNVLIDPGLDVVGPLPAELLQYRRGGEKGLLIR